MSRITEKLTRIRVQRRLALEIRTAGTPTGLPRGKARSQWAPNFGAQRVRRTLRLAGKAEFHSKEPTGCRSSDSSRYLDWPVRTPYRRTKSQQRCFAASGVDAKPFVCSYFRLFERDAGRSVDDVIHVIIRPVGIVSALRETKPGGVLTVT
jgi:hypothetical protein